MSHGADICPNCYEDKYSQNCPHYNSATGTFNPDETEGTERAGIGADTQADTGTATETGAEAIEWEVDGTSNAEYLQAICAAYSIADTYNPLTGADKDRVRRIKRKSIILADKILSEIYDEFCDKDEEAED